MIPKAELKVGIHRANTRERLERRSLFVQSVLSNVVGLTIDSKVAAILCVSAGGRTFKTFAERAEVLDSDGAARPEMASLTLGTLSATPLHLALLVNLLPNRMTWAAFIPPLGFTNVYPATTLKEGAGLARGFTLGLEQRSSTT